MSNQINQTTENERDHSERVIFGDPEIHFKREKKKDVRIIYPFKMIVSKWEEVEDPRKTVSTHKSAQRPQEIRSWIRINNS